MVLARAISSSAMRSKTVVESTKDTLDSVSVLLPCTCPFFSLSSNTVCIKVNKGLGKGLTSAIETGEVTGQKVKEAVGTSSESCAQISFPALVAYFFLILWTHG